MICKRWPTFRFSSLSYMENYYTKPYCRAAPYFIGIMTGYFLHQTRCQLELSHVSDHFWLVGSTGGSVGCKAAFSPRCLIFWLLVFLNIIFFFFLFCCYFLIFCWFRSIFFLFLNCFSVILSFFSFLFILPLTFFCFLFILPLLFRPVSHHHFVNHRFLAGWFID